MKKHLLLASVSVIAALAASAAFADDINNQTNINQTGNGGQVTIDQTGNHNTAGSATTSTIDSLVQSGDTNALTVTQSGNNNTFTGAKPTATAGSLVQSGANNAANVTQSANSSTVTLSQTGNGNGCWPHRTLAQISRPQLLRTAPAIRSLPPSQAIAAWPPSARSAPAAASAAARAVTAIQSP